MKMVPARKTSPGADAPQAPAPWAEQSSLFDPIPCQACHKPMLPHWLANYTPPEWVAAHGPKCGDPIYAPTQEALVMEWNFAHRCDCGRAFPAPYWSDREKCDACLLPSSLSPLEPTV